MSRYERKAGSWVYEELRHRIVDLIYDPGQELQLVALSQSLGISRSPVRDALLRLERDRLVDIFPQKGTRVSYLDKATILQERFLRAAVETRVFEAFMDRECSSSDWDMSLSKLQANMLLQHSAMVSRDVVTFLQCDIGFHAVFYEDAGYERIYKVVQAHTGNEHRARLLNAKVKQSMEEVMEEHQKLIDAVARKDKTAALELLEAHFGRLTGQLESLEVQFPDFFSA